MKAISTFVSSLLLVPAMSGLGATPAADLARFDKDVRPLLKSHCVACHGPEKQKGTFRVDTLNPNLFASDDGERRQDMLDQINSDDIPPKEARQKITRAQRVSDTKEGDSNLLDRTLIFYGCATGSTNLARNYPLILTGGRSFGLKHSIYHQFAENKFRLADLYVTMLNALGVENQRFADSTNYLNSVLLA